MILETHNIFSNGIIHAYKNRGTIETVRIKTKTTKFISLHWEMSVFLRYKLGFPMTKYDYYSFLSFQFFSFFSWKSTKIQISRWSFSYKHLRGFTKVYSMFNLYHFSKVNIPLFGYCLFFDMIWKTFRNYMKKKFMVFLYWTISFSLSK